MYIELLTFGYIFGGHIKVSGKEMASIYSSSIYPSPYTVSSPDSLPQLSNVANSAYHSTNLARAFTQAPFMSLTQHAEDIDELKAELLNLDLQNIEICCRAISQQDYNSNIFKQENSGSLLIYLYVIGEISKSQYSDFAYLVNFYEQFSENVVKEDEVINCDTVEVIDFNSAEHENTKNELISHEVSTEEVTNVTGLDYARYFKEHPNTPCFFMKAKLSKEQEEELYLHRGIDKMPQKPLFWFKYSCDVKIAPCYYDSKTRTVYFPTLRAQTEISEQEPYKVQIEPFLGSTSADDLAEYRKEHCHPLAIYHQTIKNNFSFPHGSYASKFYAAMHDCGHIITLNKIPKEYKDFFLEFDQIIMELLNRLSKGQSHNFNSNSREALEVLAQKSGGKIQIPIEPTKEQLKQEFEQLQIYETKLYRPFLDQAMSKIEKSGEKSFTAVQICNALYGGKPWLSPSSLNYVMHRFSEQKTEHFRILKESLVIFSEKLTPIDSEDKIRDAYWHFVRYWHHSQKN